MGELRPNISRDDSVVDVRVRVVGIRTPVARAKIIRRNVEMSATKARNA